MGEHVTIGPGVAERYDLETSGEVFARYRHVSQGMLANAFAPGMRVLDVGCGTGTEAVWLALRGVRVIAVDVMPEMVEATAARAERGGVARLVDARVLAARDVGSLAGEVGAGGLDGAYSSFGALNCEDDLSPVEEGLHRVLRPGARLVLSVMNRNCLWETLLHLATARPAKAFRRLGPQRACVTGHPFDVRYLTVGELLDVFGEAFRLVRTRGYGLLPPPYLEAPFRNLPRFLDLTTSWDPSPLRALGDHIFLELERR